MLGTRVSSIPQAIEVLRHRVGIPFIRVSEDHPEGLGDEIWCGGQFLCSGCVVGDTLPVVDLMCRSRSREVRSRGRVTFETACRFGCEHCAFEDAPPA